MSDFANIAGFPQYNTFHSWPAEPHGYAEMYFAWAKGKGLQDEFLKRNLKKYHIFVGIKSVVDNLCLRGLNEVYISEKTAIPIDIVNNLIENDK